MPMTNLTSSWRGPGQGEAAPSVPLIGGLGLVRPGPSPGPLIIHTADRYATLILARTRAG